MKPQQRADALDGRDLQRKALERWEKQKKVWNKMEETLSARRQSAALSSHPQGSSRSAKEKPSSLSLAGYRERKEDYGLLSAADAARLQGYTTRGTRYVPLGRACYPYPLYAQEHPPAEDGPSYTRVIAPEADSSAQQELRALAKASFKSLPQSSLKAGGTLEQSAALRKQQSLKEQYYRSLGHSLPEEDDLTLLLNEIEQAEYYRDKLQAYGPYIQKKLDHFMLPRSFLQVEGEAVSLTPGSATEVQGSEREDVDPVMHYEPRTISASVPSSRPGTGLGSIRGRKEVKDHAFSEEDMLRRVSEDYEDAYDKAEVLEVDKLYPQLELSTRRVYFHTRPGELSHSVLRVTNTGEVALFFNWVEVDLVEEFAEEKAGEAARTVYSEEEEEGKGGEEEALQVVINGIHSMARHTRQGRDYFHLSSPLSGCFLPGEEMLFSFSVCAPRAGHYHQTLELLTVPAASGESRTIVELVAAVDSFERPAALTAQPVAKAMEAKVAQLAAVGVVEGVLGQEELYEGAALRETVAALRAAREAPEKEKEARHATQKHTWEEENRFSYDGLPYNRAVYDTLADLHENLRQTLRQLGSPEVPLPWRGSLTQYFQDMNTLRDNVSKALLREAVDVLLRAARVSASEAETLEVLLPRAAEALIKHYDDRDAPTVKEEVASAQALHEPPVAADPNAAGSSPALGKKEKGARPTSSPGKASKSTPSGKGETASPAAPVQGALRQLRMEYNTTHLTSEEEALLEAEAAILLQRWREEREATRPRRVSQCLYQFYRILSVARLPLLEVFAGYRAEEVKCIQEMEEIRVNPVTEVIAAPVRSSSKKR